MSAFILPAVVPGDTVATFCARVVEATTAHVEAFDNYTIANEADVSVSDYNGITGPAFDWVRSVTGSTCERIRESDVWDNMGAYDADDTIGATDDDMDPVGVLEQLADTVQDADTYTDGWAEVADNAVPVYTHPRMVLYVDTLAYREDVAELGYGESYVEPVDAAGVALYMQAERIAQATATEVAAVIRSALNN